LYLHQGSDKKGKQPVQELDMSNELLRRLPQRRQVEIIRELGEAYEKGIPPEHLMIKDKGAKTMYEEMFKSKEQNKNIKLPMDSTFQLIPDKNAEKRQIYYIAGASGSGKSHIAKGLAEKYQKQFPNREVYLISKLKEDETLDSMKNPPKRLNLDKIIAAPLKDLEVFRDCMIIFDDYDAFTKPYDKLVESMMNDIATMGRHTNTTMLALTHYLSNYKKTRLMLTEATHFVLYPQSTGLQALSYLLKTYIGMDKKDIQKLRTSSTRWVCIHKNYPMYAITENSAWLINQVDEEI
jgi:Cdc6-like AAA superfamily ATPase